MLCCSLNIIPDFLYLGIHRTHLQVFEDPDGSFGDAVMREKAKHEHPAVGDENGPPPMHCGFDGAGNDENQENLGMPSNPHAWVKSIGDMDFFT